MVSQRIGRYLLFPPFAVGGVASVHLARMVGSVSFDRTCAIKRLHPHHARDPEVVAMLLDEARLAARIRHPNVGTVLDVVAEGDELLVVMEYVHGLSLAELRRCEGAWPPPVPVAVAIVEQLLRGLEAAHRTRDSRGDPLALVHRDVSPHNVLVGTDGLVRLVDFGVAQAERRSQVSHTGQVKGKLAYMAPEQLDAEPVDPRADVYAAGVVLWELLTGQRMFAGEDELAGHRRARQAAVVPPSGLRAGVSAAVDAVVARAVAAERDQRWSSAEAMAEALRGVGPLARIDEVAAWVSSSGATLLAQRQALLATIEQEPIGPPPPRAENTRSWATQPAEEPSEPTASAISSPTRGEPDRREKPSLRIREIAIAFVAFALASLLERRLRPVTPAAPAHEVASVAAPVVPPAVSATAPAPPPSISTPPVMEPATKPVAMAPRTKPVEPKPTSSASTVAGPCDPPWRVDDAGVRTFKAECL